MDHKSKPAALGNAAGSKDAFSWTATRTQSSHCPAADQARARGLRGLLDLTVMAADEAPCRASELRLRDAAARIADALTCERAVSICGRRA